MRYFIILLILMSSFIVVSCDSGSEPSNDTDPVVPDQDIDEGSVCRYGITEGRIATDASKLNFTSIYETTSAARYVNVRNSCFRNDCTNKITISKVEIEQDAIAGDFGGFKINSSPIDNVELANNESVSISVVCENIFWSAYKGTLNIYSDDSCYPIYSVELECGTKASARIVVKTPDDGEPDDKIVDFGTVNSEVLTQDVTIGNEGIRPLVITGLEITSGVSNSTAESGFYIEKTISSSVEIVNGQKEEITIGCRNDPDYPQQLIGNLLIKSNDDTSEEDRTEYNMELKCGSAPPNAPVAKLECSPDDPTIDPESAPVLTKWKLDGSASYDTVTTGGALEYFYTVLSSPAGTSGGSDIYDYVNTATPVANQYVSGVPVARFQPTMVGDYVVGLKVKNDLGVESNWATCAIKSLSNDALRVQMIWNNKNSDMDLHLLNGDDTGNMWNMSNDCYYYNCSPQYTGTKPAWGGSGTEDDPNLDVDNTSGMGPETGYIQYPQNGIYTVVVHSYNSDYGPSTVSLKVFNYANEMVKVTQKFTKTNQCWEAFKIEVLDDDVNTGKKKINVTEIVGGSGDHIIYDNCSQN